MNIKKNVAAGFPSPADDFIEDKLDLNERLIKHPAATFFVRVSGNSMIKAGIRSGDLLIIDRSLEAKSNNIVVAILNGDFTVKRISEITDESNFQVWGVVTNLIRNL